MRKPRKNHNKILTETEFSEAAQQAPNEPKKSSRNGGRNASGKKQPANKVDNAALLYRISKMFAAVRDGRELLAAIVREVKPIFDFYDIGLSVLDKSGEFYLEWASYYRELSPSETNDALNGAQNFTYPANEPLMLYAVERRAAEGKPLIINLDAEFVARFGDYPHLATEIAQGFRQFLATTLEFGGRTIGVLNFNSLEANHFDGCDLELFQAIADLVATAVFNITAGEEIIEREREKSVLLSISGDIALARNAVELLQVIRDKAQRLIPFHDTGILIVEADGEHHYDLAVNVAGWDDGTGTNQKLRELGLHRLKHPDSYVDFVMKRLTESNQPIIEDYEQRYREFDYPFFPLMKELDYKSAVAALLKSGGKAFGTLWLNALTKNHFHSKKFEIFQSLADQVAVAVANILANEEILEREREKALLLSLSEDMATIRDRQDLWRVMMEKLRPLVGFDDAVVICFAPDGKSSKTLLTLSEEKRRAQPWYQYIINQWTPTTEPLADVYGLGTAYWSTDAMLEKWQGFEGFLFMQNEGLRHTYQVSLRHGGSDLGIVLFHFKEKNLIVEAKYDLYKAVADQVAVAVANILANEEILEREREKSQLLKISEAIAQIRDKDSLLKAILERVKPVIPFDESVHLCILSEDKKSMRFFFLESSVAFGNTAEIRHYEGESWAIANTPWELTVNMTQPLVFSREFLFERYPDYWGCEVWKQAGIQTAIAIPLIIGGDQLGTLYLLSRKADQFSRINLELAKSIGDQIAVAVANILANEEIERQLAEIKALKNKIEAENIYLVEELKEHKNFGEIVGASPKIHDVFDVIEQVAATDATVLILGETGTGKELIARAIHERSPRSKRPLIKVNCAALPRELVESELFGHERGSFTGAIDRRIGKFELANGSTIFLDEIGELPLDLQIKLLHVLQEREIERLGGKGVIKLDLRVVAATNRELHLEVERGNFRRDLYYRLNTVEITLPPLHARREDIVPLVMHFARKYAAKFSRRIENVSSQMLEELYKYEFPGNVRELEHLVEQAVIFSKGDTLKLPRPLTANGGAAATENSVENDSFNIKTMDEMERDYLLRVLQETGGRVKGAGGAAALLNLPASTLHSKLKKLGIERRHVANELEGKK